MSKRKKRVVVVGSGVAGLTAALTLSESGHDVTIATKARTSDSATFYAQGGIASQWFDNIDDSRESHIADTLSAGAGLCDVQAVEVLVDNSREAISRLISRGAQFDKLSDGSYARTLEGGHNNPRIIHSGGDRTGEEVERALVDSASGSLENLMIIDHHMATTLLIENQACCGIEAIDQAGKTQCIEADHVVLSTGGAGQLFSVTTNPLLATADGVALALNAGAISADLEFMQFHPTALHVENMPRPLLSEALRGAGAILRDANGNAFMQGVHPMADLAPRDVVSREIARVLREQDAECVYLDARMIDDFSVRYPTIFTSCYGAGFDPSTDLLPVSPAAHYYCGGVATDTYGATSLPGLWAAGEVACNGVHGANRLASNSLLDGLVFGERVAHAIHANQVGPTSTGIFRNVPQSFIEESQSLHIADEYPLVLPEEIHDTSIRPCVQSMMTTNVGIVRRDDDLSDVESLLKSLSDQARRAGSHEPAHFERYELANIIRVASSMARSALARRESRGCHTHEEYRTSREELNGRFMTYSDNEPLSFIKM